MNCVNHADVANIAYCIKCGKALCGDCVRLVQGSVYCELCLAEGMSGGSARAEERRQPAQTAGGTSPEAAFILGLLPGVGAIYNAEYFKAAVHLVLFGSLVTIADHSRGAMEPMSALLAFGFYVYMPFEAYFTAKKRKLARTGIDLETPFDNFNQRLGEIKDKELWGGVALVVIGGLFLLDNFGVLALYRVAQLWPGLLVLAGFWLIRRHREGKGA